MAFLKLNVELLYLIILGLLISLSFADQNNDNDKTTIHSEHRAQSSGANMDPFGIWKSTGGMIRKGIRMLRDNLQEGVKIAQMLKEDMDSGISHMVSKNGQQRQAQVSEKPSHNLSESISPNSSDSDEADTSVEDMTYNSQSHGPRHSMIKQKQLQNREGMLGGFLRLVGFDSSSIGIIVLNVLIFIAEMVTSSLVGKDSNGINDRRALKTNIMEWLTTGHNEKVELIFEQAQNKSLPENIIKLLQTRTGNKTSCLQLLLCKLKPFISSIQSTVTEQINQTNLMNLPSFNEKYLSSVWNKLNQLLPTKTNFMKYGDNCEVKYPVCQLLKFEERKTP